MTASRSIRAGETIHLRARFKDDLGDGAQATNVYVHIFEPGTVDFDLANALVVSGVPIYLGEGIFDYAYTTPGTGPDGFWYDQWEGVLTGQILDARLTFEVSASGVIEQLPAQLNENNIVRVVIPSGIMATDGTELADEYEFEFLTPTVPSYSSVRKVRLEVGSYVHNLYDDVIQLAILEASLEADVLTFKTTNQNTNLYEHARREYVTCLASQMLLQNIASGSLRAKTLADLSVEYDTNAITGTMDRIRDCLGKWEPQLLAGGLARTAAQPVGVVKGEYDPDRPVFSRMWRSTEDGGISRRIPAANTRDRNVGQRRSLRSYKKRYW